MHSVYMITNNLNGKQYVGRTGGSPTGRFVSHCRQNSLLGNALRFYGKDNFALEILHRDLTYERSVVVERRMIRALKTLKPNGYNISACEIGQEHLSRETKGKIRQAHLGKRLSAETIEKIRQGNLGKKRSAETRERNRIASLGRKHSLETLKKISQSSLGRVHSEEVRKKIAAHSSSSGFKGHKHSEETKRRMSAVRKGKPRDAKKVQAERDEGV